MYQKDAGGRLVELTPAAFVLQDADRFRSKMNSIAYGNVMAKAAEDYKQVTCCLGATSLVVLLLPRCVYSPSSP